MNPARTFGSALLARDFPGLWIYFTAPPLGMLLAAEAVHAPFRGATGSLRQAPPPSQRTVHLRLRRERARSRAVGVIGGHRPLALKPLA